MFFFQVVFHFINPFTLLWNRLVWSVLWAFLICHFFIVRMLFCLFSFFSPYNNFIWNLTFILFCCLFLWKIRFSEFLEWDGIQDGFSKSIDSLSLLFLCNVRKNMVVSSVFPSPPFILTFSLSFLLSSFCLTFILLPVVSAQYEGSVLEGSTGFSVSRICKS